MLGEFLDPREEFSWTKYWSGEYYALRNFLAAKSLQSEIFTRRRELAKSKEKITFLARSKERNEILPSVKKIRRI